MNGIAYISENKIYTIKDGKTEELPCGRLEKYKETLSDIRRRNEWKTTGSGAKFMGTDTPQMNEDDIFCELGGIAVFENRLVYGMRLDESGCIYSRSLDRNDMNENLIVSGKDIFPGRMNCLGNKLAVSCGENAHEKHISVYELPSSSCREFTDGDSIEEAPCFDGEDRIYFSTAGYGRDRYGDIAAVQNKSIVCLDISAGRMDEICSDEKYDLLCPKPDGEGGLYCIKRDKESDETDIGSVLMDIVLFPYRIVKAIMGFLNLFSMMFGGESLKSGGSAKAKRRNEKAVFIEGNLVNAEKNLKDAQKRGEKYPGIMPQSSRLVHILSDGTEKLIRGGVLDYIVLSEGGFAVSNGSHIIITDADGNDKEAYKADRAVSLVRF